MSVDRNGGWIPPSRRTREQQRFAEEFAEEVGTFSQRMLGSVKEPAMVFGPQLELELLGALLPRLWQVTGSCVGVGSGHACRMAACGDIFFREDYESLIINYPFAPYGVGRSYQWNNTGEGSFGSLQARAVKEFGTLPWDDDRVPKPTIRNGWAKWTKSQELSWSHPKAWPVPKSELEPDAQKYSIGTVAQVKTTGEAKQVLAQGYGLTIASMFGTRRSEVRGDVAIAERSASWAHQMAIDSYWVHPAYNLLFWVQNSWGPSPSIHTPCPTMGELGINGGFWITERTFADILDDRDAECFAHSNTNGFPKQEFEWQWVEPDWRD